MGMFDTITFENDIPDPDLRDREWQTRSLDETLTHYRISSDGELFATRTETRTRENPDSWLGWDFEVIREWEEKVDFHGVIEAYTDENLDDGSRRWVIYGAYFTYGKLTSLERTEEVLSPPKPQPVLEDDGPRQVIRTGELEVDLPATIQVAHFEQEGQLYVLKLRFDGHLHAWPAGTEVEIRGTRHGSPDEPTVRSIGAVRHVTGAEIRLLATDTGHRDDSVFVLALGDYLDAESRA